MLQAGITEVRYLHPWDPVEAYRDEALAKQYAELRSRFRVFEPVGDPANDDPNMFAGVIGAPPPRR
jgi:hypothetical protein